MHRFFVLICSMFWALGLTGQEPLSQYLRKGAKPNEYISIPFHIINDLPVAFLTLSGHPHQLFLIDTGSTYTLISEETAEILHIPLISDSYSEFAASGSKAVSGRIAKKVRIDSGKFGIYVGPAPAISLKELASYFGQPVAGILGFNVIRAHPTIFDFISGTMGIFMPDSFQLDNSPGRVALRECQSSLIIDAKIRVGSSAYLPAALMVDTGTQVPLELYSPYVEKEHLLMQDGLKKVELEGVGGRHDASHGHPGYLRMNDREIKLADVYLSQAESGIASRTDIDGALGVQGLKRSQLIINCSEGYAIINPASN
jgi:hypothetical protein